MPAGAARTPSAGEVPSDRWLALLADQPSSESDDTLIVLFMCCHPSLSPASQVALTLRAVGGLTTAEIARAFLVPEATMTRRITRAKRAHQGQRRPVRHAGGRRARPNGSAPSSTCST